MRPIPLPSLAARHLLAFAGIARPAPFEQSLAAAEIRVDETVAFPDHHWYRLTELQGLAVRARAHGADGLVTTEKDWVRLRRLGPTALPIYVFGVRLELIADEAAWWAAFERACPSR